MRWKMLTGSLLIVATVWAGSFASATYIPVQIENDGLTSVKFNLCENAVREALTWVPVRHLSGLRNVALHNHTDWHRGLAGDSVIYLRCLDDLAELKSVLIHEIGHIVDINLARSNQRLNYFSEISWLNDNLAVADDTGFVSGYAATDAFEDFAETYAYYLLHGDKFRTLMTASSITKRKYDFMEYSIFAGTEYSLENKTDPLTSGSNLARVEFSYDVTRLKYQR